MPEFILYGYSIYSNLEYRLSSRALININNGRIKRLGKTKARLFEYLLAKAESECIYDNDIIIDVFEDYGLRCSKSYLLATIKDIRAAFLSVGFERNPIIRQGRNAYLIDNSVIQKIYVEGHCVQPQEMLLDWRKERWLAELLVYTQNTFIRQAVLSLVQGHNVLFFDNRLQFLVSATVIARPVILIDTLVSEGRDVRWLYAKLVSRGLSSRINYIAPLQVAENRYLKGFSLITNMAQLKLLCPPQKRGGIEESDLRPERIIALHVEKILRQSEIDFLTSFYVPQTMQFRSRSKSEASRLYYIRRKLFFESSSELKQLMLYLSHYDALQDQTQEEKAENGNLKMRWPAPRTLASA